MGVDMYYTSFFGIRLPEDISEKLLEKYEWWEGNNIAGDTKVGIINATPMGDPTYYAILSDSYDMAEVYEVDGVKSHPDKNMDDWFPILRFLTDNNIYREASENGRHPPICWHSGIVFS